MKLGKIGIALAVFIGMHTLHAVNLIGIYNNLPDSYRVSIQGTQYTSVVGKPLELEMALPVKVDIFYADNKDPKTITIDETQESSTCRGYGVKASVPEYANSGNTICVPSSTTRFIPGKKVNAFQNVLLVLDINPDAGAADLPFKFGITAWTTNKFPWGDKTVYNPSDSSATSFSKGLQVLQGYAAWGSGITPRLYHGAILHVYNDSPFTLYFTRNVTPESPDKDLSPYNYEQLVPPYSAVPWISSWIPKLSNADTPSKTAIKIYALKPPVQGTDLPPVPTDLIFSAGSQELDIPTKPVSEVIASMQQQVPSFTSTVTKQPDLSQLTKQKLNFISNTYYKIATDASTNKVVVKKCTVKKPSTCQMTSNSLNATIDGTQPNYFKLVVTGDEKGKFDVSLTQIPDEKVRD